MTGKLPNFIAIRIDTHYASVLTKPEALLDYVGAKESIYTPVTKIQVEKAQIDSKYVHLRFCYNNRYLARVDGGTDDVWLVACSVEPEEDKFKRSCTLFEPEIPDSPGDGLFLKHAETGKYVKFKQESERKSCPKKNEKECKDCNCFYLDNSPFQLRYEDWDSLVMLPKYVAFKGDNGKYLKCRSNEEHVFFEFSSDDRKGKETAFVVTMISRGYLYIKSFCSDKYMCLTNKPGKPTGKSDWICADSTDSETHIPRRFRFQAVRRNGKTIALLSNNGKYCCRHKDGQFTDCFAAEARDLNQYSRLEVEELVQERKICNLSYQLDKARIYYQKPIVLCKGPPNSALTVKYDEIRSFKSSLGAKVGDCTTATAKVEAGIPVIAKDKGEISIEDSAKASALLFEWNRETKSPIKKEVTFPSTSQSKKSVIVKFVATKVKIDVPFHYTQHSKVSIDGRLDITEHKDGVFSGVNYHSFHFEEEP